MQSTYTITTAARLRNVSRQAVYMAIRSKRLKAQKGKGKWTISAKDLEDYVKSLYSRDFSKYNGELVYDKSKGLYSVSEAADLLGMDKQSIYYCLRTNKIRSEKKGYHWVINKDDIKEYRKIMIDKPKKRGS